MTHALANSLAAGLYGTSLAVHKPPTDQAFAWPRWQLWASVAFSGGHSSFRLADSANYAESVPRLVQPGWNYLATCAGLPNGKQSARWLARSQSSPPVPVRVLADRCSHKRRTGWRSFFGYAGRLRTGFADPG